MDRPGIRVDRMMEHVAVLRGLFADGPLDFAGQHYRISGLDGSPKPFRPGGPPILIAGGGRRLLTFAARQADIIGVNPSLPMSGTRPDRRAASMDEKFSWIRAAAGPRLGDLEFHAWLRFAAITETARAEAEFLAGEFGAGAEDVLASPVVLMGSVGEIVDRLHERRERWGYTYYTVQQPAARPFAAVLAELTGS